MTSTQEPNTMAPQSALCIWLRKWKAKLVVPIYFGTKTSEFYLRIISFSSLESLRTSCLYIRNGKLDTKWRRRKTRSRKEKSRTALVRMVNSLPKHKVSTSF